MSFQSAVDSCSDDSSLLARKIQSLAGPYLQFFPDVDGILNNHSYALLPQILHGEHCEDFEILDQSLPFLSLRIGQANAADGYVKMMQLKLPRGRSSHVYRIENLRSLTETRNDDQYAATI